METERLSRTLSHALRHEPGQYGLELDERGWAPLDRLLASLRERGGAWSEVDREDVERVLRSPGRQRFELREGRIRALYGHSVAVSVEGREAAPPERLYHGTTPEAAERVRSEGLRPMGREHVHLSPDRPTARDVGRRRAAEPVVLTVRASDAHEAGVPFYRGGEDVWLAGPVPARFVESA